MDNPRPKAKIGDIIIGDLHPVKGTVMMEVASAYIGEHFMWVYKDKDGIEIVERHIHWIFQSHKHDTKGFQIR